MKAHFIPWVLAAIALPTIVFAQSRATDFQGDVELDVPTVRHARDELDHAVDEGDSASEQRIRGRAPTPPDIAPRIGEALTAIPGVHERQHRVTLRFEPGKVEVSSELEFDSQASTPAEIVYRLAAPKRALITHFEICDERGCRAGQRNSDAELPRALERYADLIRSRPMRDNADTADDFEHASAPSATAESVDDARGHAILIRAAAIWPVHALIARVTYVVPLRIYGGEMFFDVLPRGTDPRAARLSLSVLPCAHANVFVEGSDAGDEPWSADAWVRTRVNVRFDATLTRAREAKDIALLVDVSPSMRGPTEGRILPAISAILADAPDGSEILADAFAARDTPLIAESEAAAGVSLTSFEGINGAQLGSSTRVVAAEQFIRNAIRKHARKTHELEIVVIGDGGLTDSAESRHLLHELAHRAAHGEFRFVVVNLSDQPTRALLGNTTIEAHGIELVPMRDGEQSDLTVDDVFLRAEFRQLFEARANTNISPPHSRGAVPVGEKYFSALPDIDDDGAYRNSCVRAGPAFTRDGLSSDAHPVALAAPLRCAAPPAIVINPPRASGLPAETVLNMLRTRIIPPARACFRQDRRGRADYQTRATYEFHVADREISSTEVRGEIAPALRACLEDTLERLDIPYFQGEIFVRYPVHTQSQEPDPVIELEENIRTQIDQQFPNAGDLREHLP